MWGWAMVRVCKGALIINNSNDSPIIADINNNISYKQTSCGFIARLLRIGNYSHFRTRAIFPECARPETSSVRTNRFVPCSIPPTGPDNVPTNTITPIAHLQIPPKPLPRKQSQRSWRKTMASAWIRQQGQPRPD